MIFKHDDETYDVVLVQDNDDDVIIRVEGEEFHIALDQLVERRDIDGKLTKEVLIELAKEALSDV